MLRKGTIKNLNFMRKLMFSLSAFLLVSAFSMTTEMEHAGCNEGHQAYGKQSSGSNYSLVCDGSTTASCCTSKPSPQQ